jgi:hypothetical protein
MDREKAERFLKAGESKEVMTTPKGTQLIFARADNKEIDRIEKLSDEQLLKEWRGMVYCIEVVQSFSVMDLQIQALYEMEIDSRPHLHNKASNIYEKLKKEAIAYEGKI